MDIKNISENYLVRKLNNGDIPQILNLMNGNPEYFKFVPPSPTEETVKDDLIVLPPNKTSKDKFYLGYFDKHNTLIALLDLILEYPNKETAFVGFFMLNMDFQGMGIGTKIITQLCEYLKREGFTFIRLGYIEKNVKARNFWLKNGFAPTGVIAHEELYDIIVMQKAI